MDQNHTAFAETELARYSRNQVLAAVLTAATEQNLPLAIWKLPHDQEINLVISLGEIQQLTQIDLQTLPKGFVFSPFDQTKQKSLFIKSDIHLSFDFSEVNTLSSIENINGERANRFLKLVNHRLENEERETRYHSKEIKEQTTAKDYLELVQLGIEQIKSGTFEKIVPARTKSIELDADFNLINQFISLCESYQNAFVSVVTSPETGTWLGATPELLLEVEGDVFKTVALAGTQKRDENKALSETAWTQKEIEEQALVCRYIINCFKKIRLREYEERGPKTAIAGHLLHLKTEFRVDMKSTNFPELGTVMLELLHPTSAVAGMPKTPALEFIQNHEGFNREFYSGFLGPIQNHSKTSIFVNLRCMQLLHKHAILYAGAGVTEDSNPQKELEETEMKFNTLLNTMNTLK